MASTQQRSPTSDVSFTGTWTGSAGVRYQSVDDHPDSGNPIADGLTHGTTTAGEGLFGFTAFTVPAGSKNITVQVIYYDFKNGSQSAAVSARIRCNDTTGRDASTHNPGNGNGNIALRTDDYGVNNPKSGAAWTVDEVNGSGTNGLTAFGVRGSDVNPSTTFSSIICQVTYDAPVVGTLTKTLDDVGKSIAGTSTITGTLSKTLDSVGFAGAAQARAAGTLSKTLDGAILSSAGSSTVTGALSKTLDGASLSSTGTVSGGGGPVTGTLAKTLDGATLSAAGSAPAHGTLSKTLAGLSISSAGAALVRGTLAKTLDGATLSASGSAPVRGSLSKTLDGASLSSAGTAPVRGTAAVQLAGSSLSAAGNAPVRGSLVAQLSGASLSSVGTSKVSGTLAKTLAGASIAAFGVAPVRGTLTRTLGAVTLASGGSALGVTPPGEVEQVYASLATTHSQEIALSSSQSHDVALVSEIAVSVEML